MFVVHGGRGAGKDFTLTGGMLDESQADLTTSKRREPGLIRLAYEAVIAQICANTNAQFTVQMSCGIIQDEEMDDLLSDENHDIELGRKSRQTVTRFQLSRKHVNSIKQLTQLLQQVNYKREQLRSNNETVLFEIIVEKFSLDPADYDSRTTLSKLCFIKLPPAELLLDPSVASHMPEAEGLSAAQRMVLLNL